MKRKLLSLWSTHFIPQPFIRSRKVVEPTPGTTNLYVSSAVYSSRYLTWTNQRRIFLGIAALLICIIAIVYYQYNKQVLAITDVAGERVSTTALLSAFQNSEVQANKKYLNKVLQVTGNVAEIKPGTNNNPQVLLDANDPMSTIACSIENSQQEVKAGETITVKGICTGYLNDVILIKCIVVPLQKEDI